MAIRTIKVDITGLKEIEKAQKSVSALRDSVLDFEKKLGKMGGKNSSPLSFNVNIMFNTDKVLKDYLALKKQIENIPILVGTKEGQTSRRTSSGSSSRDALGSNGYIKVRDQDYQSWRNLNKAINDVSNSTISLSSNMIKLGAVNPAKGLLSVFNRVNSSVLDIQKSLMGFVGNKISGAIGSAIQGTIGAVRGGVSQLKNEANDLGDAMQVYRINMEALGFDEKTVNKSIKRLGDYGKSTVFDATDLLEQASTYTAYGRKDAEQIVKGYAGLLAQTKNPIEGMKTVTEQTAQMLASGVLNQQDYKFIRQRLSALGASRLNAELTALANSKGEDTIISATKKRLISADEYLDVVNRLGNDETFQNLVNSIITPRQAIANLKETLSNLLVFDKIDEEGNAKPGALNQVYVATRDFIKGITEIVGTAKFEEYVTKLGNSIGSTIQSINKFGSAWKLAFSNEIINSIERFSKAFSEGFKGTDVGSQFFNVTKSFLGVLNDTGRQFGTFTRDIVKSGAELTESLAKMSSQAITGGALRVISGIVEIYNNLAKLAVDSGELRIVSSLFLNVTETINTLIRAINPSQVTQVLESVKNLVGGVTSFATKLATKTNVIQTLADVFKGVLDALSEIVTKIGTFSPSTVNRALDSLKRAILGIVGHIKPLIVEISKSVINIAGSASGENFFRAVSNFVKAVVDGIRKTLVSIGGSVEGGMKSIINFMTLITQLATGVATMLGSVGKYIITGFVITKFLSWATGIISALTTVATAMSSVTNGKLNPLGLGGQFGANSVVNSARRGVTYLPSSEAPNGMSRVARNGHFVAQNGNMSRVDRNKANRLAGYKTVGLLGGQIAVDSLNGYVQNSDFSQGTKNFSNAFANTASWATSGALIGSAFSPVGTLIGGGVGALIGLGTSIYDIINKENESKKLEEEAKKQAKEEAKANYTQRLESIKQLADENAKIRDSFFKTIQKDSNLAESISNANSYIDAIKNNTGSIQTALKTLGVESAKVPENVKDLFVQVGDKVKSWNELKQETGIEDDTRLLQALQVAQSALGEEYVNFVNSTGEQLIKQVRTLSEGDFNRNKANANTFEATFQKLGLALQEGRNFVFKDISSITEEIKGIIDSKDFYSKEDKAKALQALYERIGADTSSIVTQSIDKQFEIAKQIAKEGSVLGETNEQRHASLAKTINEKLGNFSTVFEDFIENNAVKELEQVNALLDEAKAVKAEQGTIAGKLKAKEFVQKLDGLVKDGSLKLEEANAIISSSGVSRLSTENVKRSTVGYSNSIVSMLNDSTFPILTAKGIMDNSGISGISTSGISSAVGALHSAVSLSINDAIAKLSEGIEKARQSLNWDEFNALSNERRITEYARYRRTGGLIPEYHSNGLPVGINWQSRGTDTVPTMLTPGEYVLRKKAVDSLGTSFLNNLNKFGVSALQSVGKSTIINNVYNTNNAKISQNIDNKSQYLNGMFGVDKLMRYV